MLRCYRVSDDMHAKRSCIACMLVKRDGLCSVTWMLQKLHSPWKMASYRIQCYDITGCLVLCMQNEVILPTGCSKFSYKSYILRERWLLIASNVTMLQGVWWCACKNEVVFPLCWWNGKVYVQSHWCYKSYILSDRWLLIESTVTMLQGVWWCACKIRSCFPFMLVKRAGVCSVTFIWCYKSYILRERRLIMESSVMMLQGVWWYACKTKLYRVYAGETGWSNFSYIGFTKVTFSVKDGVL